MKIDVCGIPFSVERVSGSFSCKPDPFGESDAIRAMIKISSLCSPEQFDATLIHEWAHGVCQCYGCDSNEPMILALSQELYRLGFRVKILDSKEKSK